MKKRVNIYMPRWMRGFVIAVTAPIWGMLFYVTFFMPEENLPPLAFGIVSFVLLLVVGMVWLTAGRLPIYVAEIEDEPPPGGER
jgi:hypothetical protein